MLTFSDYKFKSGKFDYCIKNVPTIIEPKTKRKGYSDEVGFFLIMLQSDMEEGNLPSVVEYQEKEEYKNEPIYKFIANAK